MMTYQFQNFTIKHNSMGGATLELSKNAVWEVIKNDKDFWKMKLYKIKVKQISHSTSGPMWGYSWPGQISYITGYHWAKNLAEAKKIGEVIEQVHPKLLKKPAPKESVSQLGAKDESA